jgi:uncharacterized protein (TIGR02757 family)
MPSVPRSHRDARLAERLEALYRAWGPQTSSFDPITFPARYEAPEDREVVGWIASAFAYGRVETILWNVGRLLETLGPHPARMLDSLEDFAAFSRDALGGFRHRFHGGKDAAALLFAIATTRRQAGSVRAFFEGERREEERDVAGLLARVSERLVRLDWRPALGGRRLPEDSPVRFFFPSPADGSACKRWNLYLRWMVRKDALDFGLWPDIGTERLVIPTDTHIHLVSRRLGLTRRRAADWRTAREITDKLARLDPEDPVRYDYALCRIGIHGICRPLLSRSRCGECLAAGACPAAARRRAAA